MSARHRWAIALLLALAAVLLAGASPTGPTPAAAAPAQPAACDWDTELLRALDELGEHPPRWTITDHVDDRLGSTDLDELTATIDPDTPCPMVASVVRHEWMHLQQGWTHGGLAAAVEHYGGRAELEVVADCGSMLLGSQHTPYVDDHLRETGVACTKPRLEEARALIGPQIR